jgi:hypothetical protein
MGAGEEAMNEPTLDKLVRRLDQVERDNQRLKRPGVVVSLTCASSARIERYFGAHPNSVDYPNRGNELSTEVVYSLLPKSQHDTWIFVGS